MDSAEQRDELAPVAVGTRVASRHPHRSVHAAFPHSPTSGPNGKCLPYALQRLCHAYPALSPVRALLVCISLGLRPWIAPPCSPASQLLWRSPTSRTRASS